MDWLSDFELFLFDFDGLLVDTESLHFEAYQKLCEEKGYQLPWDFKTYCQIAHGSSTGLRDRIYALFPELQKAFPEWKTLYERKKALYLELLALGKLKLMPGVEAFLKKLHQSGKKMAVATNSFRTSVEAIKKHLPALYLIPDWICREDYKDPKPSPDAYLTAIEKMGSHPKKCIGFEDSKRGLEALKKAGVFPVLISPKELLDHFGELEGVSYFESFAVMDFCQK